MLERIQSKFIYLEPARKDWAERAGDACLFPIRYVLGCAALKTDGRERFEKRIVLEDKVRRVAAGIFAALLFPFTGLATLLGIAALGCSKSYGRTLALPFREAVGGAVSRAEAEEEESGEALRLIVDTSRLPPPKLALDPRDDFVFVDEHPRSGRERELPPEEVAVFRINSQCKLKVYATQGGAAGALHAICGKPEKGMYCCDAAKERGNLVQWIRGQCTKGQLPDQADYLFTVQFYQMLKGSWKNVYSEFKSPEVMTLFNRLEQCWQQAGNQSKQVALIEQFTKSYCVRQAYLKRLGNPDLPLNVPEIRMAAVAAGKSVCIYEKDADKPSWINPGQEESVVIWHDGRGGYKRAALCGI